MLPPKHPGGANSVEGKKKDYLRERRHKREREQLLKEQQQEKDEKENKYYEKDEW